MHTEHELDMALSEINEIVQSVLNNLYDQIINAYFAISIYIVYLYVKFINAYNDFIVWCILNVPSAILEIYWNYFADDHMNLYIMASIAPEQIIRLKMLFYHNLLTDYDGAPHIKINNFDRLVNLLIIKYSMDRYPPHCFKKELIINCADNKYCREIEDDEQNILFGCINL